jgi:hypothetical protein
MNAVAKFFHEIWNPHCINCETEREIDRIDPLVDVLRSELDRVNRNNERLLEQLFDKAKSERNVPVEEEIKPFKRDFNPIPPNRVAWDARRRELEQASRDQARALAAVTKENTVTEDDLDKELNSVKEIING